MIDALWTIVKITVVGAVGYVVIRWILSKAGVWQPLMDAVRVGVGLLLKKVGL